MTRICVHQPDFVPWLGFFHRLLRCDVFVVLDNVQFLRRGWQHRDRIRQGGQPLWLTVPVRKAGRYDQTIAEVEIDNDIDWRRKHLGTLASAYRRAPYYQPIMERLEAIYGDDDRFLIEFNRKLLGMALAELGITIETVSASSLLIEGTSTARLVAITRALGGTTYVTGMGSRSYLDETLFEAANIRVFWQDFHPPPHPQQGEGFLAGLSVLDALFNLGGAETRRLLEAVP